MNYQQPLQLLANLRKHALVLAEQVKKNPQPQPTPSAAASQASAAGGSGQ